MAQYLASETKRKFELTEQDAARIRLLIRHRIEELKSSQMPDEAVSNWERIKDKLQ